jgi:hypothetical protein
MCPNHARSRLAWLAVVDALRGYYPTPRIESRRQLGAATLLMMASEVVFIGGRTDVGKRSVGFEMHPTLSAVGIRHCVIARDILDMAYPTPWEHNLAEPNLAAMWANYRSLGHRRLTYMNSASVLPNETNRLADAMGDAPRIVSILLSGTDTAATQRLGQREVGAGLELHLKTSADMADLLQRGVDGFVRHIPTENRQ